VSLDSPRREELAESFSIARCSKQREQRPCGKFPCSSPPQLWQHAFSAITRASRNSRRRRHSSERANRMNASTPSKGPRAHTARLLPRDRPQRPPRSIEWRVIPIASRVSSVRHRATPQHILADWREKRGTVSENCAGPSGGVNARSRSSSRVNDHGRSSIEEVCGVASTTDLS
jgi:hypothetical protein